MRSSDHDSSSAGGKKYQKYSEKRRGRIEKTYAEKYNKNSKKPLQNGESYGIILSRDILIPCSIYDRARDQKEVTSMNKYELALVVSARLEDEERVATVEKVKAYIERFGGQITNVDDWGKKRLAYEIQKMKEGFFYFIQFDAAGTAPAEIEARVRIMDNVLRYLVVRQDA